MMSTCYKGQGINTSQSTMHINIVTLRCKVRTRHCQNDIVIYPILQHSLSKTTFARPASVLTSLYSSTECRGNCSNDPMQHSARSTTPLSLIHISEPTR